MEIFGFWRERDWSKKSYYGNNTKGVICFFCDMVPGFRNTALNFQRYRFVGN